MRPLKEAVSFPGDFSTRRGWNPLPDVPLDEQNNHCKEIRMKKQMIRVLTLALCVVMVLGLAACGSNGQGTAPAQECCFGVCLEEQLCYHPDG